MPAIKIHKTTTLPSTLEGHSIYLVAPAAKPDYVEMYVTNADATAVRRVITEQDVINLINASGSAGSGIQIVNDIAARNALTPVNGQLVYVLNATGDPTVANGAASYIWKADTSEWIKLTEFESMDVIVQWSNIQGAPTSSPSAIDAAVANSHTHANMTELNKIGEDGNGNFTYNGQPPRARLEVAGW